jgi:ribose transport system substrate-binding protein
MGIEVVQAIIKHSQGEEVPEQILIPTSLYRQADAEKDPELK